MAIPFNRGNFAPGGNVPERIRGVVDLAGFVQYDYGGKRDVPTLAARIDLTDITKGGPVKEDPYKLYWSAGSLDLFRPSEDGESPIDEDDMETVCPECVKVGERDQWVENTNFQLLCWSLEDLDGFPTAEIHESGKLEALQGMTLEFVRTEQPPREGLEKDDEGAEKKKYYYYKCVDFEPAGGKKARTRKSSGKASSRRRPSRRKAEPADQGFDLNAAIVEILSEADSNEMEVDALRKALLRVVPKEHKSAVFANIKTTKIDAFDAEGWFYDSEDEVCVIEDD